MDPYIIAPDILMKFSAYLDQIPFHNIRNISTTVAGAAESICNYYAYKALQQQSLTIQFADEVTTSSHAVNQIADLIKASGKPLLIKFPSVHICLDFEDSMFIFASSGWSSAFRLDGQWHTMLTLRKKISFIAQRCEIYKTARLLSWAENSRNTLL